MTQLGTSLRFAALSAVVELLTRVAGTGRLRLVSGAWVGEIELRRGQIIGATLGDERGLPALESIAVGFLDGELNFAAGAVAEDGAALLPVEHQVERLRQLEAERKQLKVSVGSLQVVPRLTDAGDANRNVTIGASALQLIPQLMWGQTLEQIARRRGLARTLRQVSVLARAGVLALESPPSTSPTSDPKPPAGEERPGRPLPARVLAARNQPDPTDARVPPEPKRARPTRNLKRETQ
jgi:hypothetical protein